MLKLAAKRILFANFCLVVMLAIATSLRQRVFLQSQSKLITKCLSTAVQPAAIQKVPREPPAWIDVSDNEFLKLGLNDQLMQAVAAQGFKKPTPVQATVIPRLLNRENLVMAASTGSGKTLAFSLPAIQNLNIQEQLGYQRTAKRPRCLILVPTRELSRQVLDSIKQVGHYSKVSSAAIMGGEDYAIQKRALDRVVDIVVASPGRLMQHKDRDHVYFSHVNTIIIDEVDTMLTQGFGSDIRSILRNVLKRAQLDKTEVQIVMATATLTKAVRALLADVEGGGGFNIEYNDPGNLTPKKFDGTEIRVKMNVVEVDGLHRSLPHVKHHFEETKGEDKMNFLKTVLARTKLQRTLIFCNTIASCRAVDYAINEDLRLRTISYHGDMNSIEREENLAKFRSGEETIMTCTDIAARGLDIPEIDHVVMFDFPMNPIDYIHRAGRCGRAGRKGIVTALVSKRDEVLANAIKGAIVRELPIDSLTASKKDYSDGGKLAFVVGRKSVLKKKPSALPKSGPGKFETRGRSSFGRSSSGSSSPSASSPRPSRPPSSPAARWSKSDASVRSASSSPTRESSPRSGDSRSSSPSSSYGGSKRFSSPSSTGGRSGGYSSGGGRPGGSRPGGNRTGGGGGRSVARSGGGGRR